MKPINRRSLIACAFASAGLTAFDRAAAAAQQRAGNDAPISPKDNLKVTKLETFLVKPRWLFLKIHTNVKEIVGLGEPITEGRALTCAEAVKEIEPYLMGKDPRAVVHHWQAIYRHAFYRGGPILTIALSGIDQALWDIKGKALGVPVYELLGGPTRNRVRVYAHAGVDDPSTCRQAIAKGFTAFKTGPAKKRPARYIESPAAVQYAAEKFGEFRKRSATEIDIAIDFHGAISPATAKLLIKAMEPYSPMFIEEPCQAPEPRHDGRDRARHLPAHRHRRARFHQVGLPRGSGEARGHRLAAGPCHAGGITEVRLIAGMAEAYYATIAPHNPLGPINRSPPACRSRRRSRTSYARSKCRWARAIIKKPFTVRNGYLDLPTGPGLGIELDENAMADKIGHDWRNPEAYDADDGAAVDW